MPYVLPLLLPCRLYEDLFTGERRNPNGCPIAATFFVSHEWTDYGQVGQPRDIQRLTTNPFSFRVAYPTGTCRLCVI
jgi:hypothetical protein